MENNPYSDIIDLPCPTSKNHPRMSMQNRAAQFAPFAALTGYDSIIDEMARITSPELLLDDEAKNLLDAKFRILEEKINETPFITVTHFVADEKKSGGKYVTSCGYLRVINLSERFIEFTDKVKIELKNIYNVESDIFGIMNN